MLTIIYINLLKVKIKLVAKVESDMKTPFSIATPLRCSGGRYSTLHLIRTL